MESMWGGAPEPDSSVGELSHLRAERHYYPHILEGDTASLIFNLIALNFKHEGT